MGMTIEEAITRYKNNAEHERTHGNLQGCLEFRQLVEWLRKYQQIQDIIEYHMLKSLPKKNMSGFQKDILEVIDNGNDD